MSINVLLVRPKPSKETIGLQNVMICEPLELEYLVSNLALDGHVVNIVDMIIERKRIEYFVKKYNPDVIGITSYIAHVNVVKEYARKIKTINADIKVIVGGVHAEVVPEDFVDEAIDYIIMSNGIQTFKEILKQIETYDIEDVGIRGVYGGANVEKLTDFKHVFPDRNSVSKYRHKYYYMFHNPCALIKTSFGCPYQCTFCFCRKITGDKYFVRGMEEVIEELKGIPEKEIYVVDDNFLFDKEKLFKFCKLIRENNLKKNFLVYGRADFIAKNEIVIKELAICGLRAVIVGVESGNEEELKKYDKKSSVSLNEEAVRILQRYDIECYATLILGIDWNRKDFNNLYRWLRKLNIKFVNLQPFTPLPGTEMFEEYKDKLIIPRECYEKWDLAHLTVKPSKMSVRKYYWNIIKLYYKVIMNPKTIKYIIGKYGIKETLKLSVGSSRITFQYLKKLIKS